MQAHQAGEHARQVKHAKHMSPLGRYLADSFGRDLLINSSLIIVHINFDGHIERRNLMIPLNA